MITRERIKDIMASIPFADPHGFVEVEPTELAELCEASLRGLDAAILASTLESYVDAIDDAAASADKLVEALKRECCCLDDTECCDACEALDAYRKAAK